MAIRGDDPLKIQQRAGHTTFDMTQKYIRTAEAVGEAIGDVFPPLPAGLQNAEGQLNCPKEPQVCDFIVEAPGIEPGSTHSAVFRRSPIEASSSPTKVNSLDHSLPRDLARNH